MKGVLHIDYYTIRLASILFFPIFLVKRELKNTRAAIIHNTEVKVLDQRPFALASCLVEVKERGGGACFGTVMVA
jgi:hypothetical protein